jgi:phosphatidylinositol N-acetylglucosaminyltransferase subunit C
MSTPSSPPASPASIPSSAPAPVPPPVPVETHPNRRALKRLGQSQPTPDSSFLAPEDAYKTYSPPRLRPLHEVTSSGVASLNGTLQSSQAASAAAAALRPAVASLRPPPAIPVSARLEHGRQARNTSRKRRAPGGWKKLLWIRQQCVNFACYVT